MKIPTVFKPLSSAQKAAATNVFGTSLEFSVIYLTELTGLGNRAFAFTVPPLISGPPYTFLNVGTYNPPQSTLIHELAHAWQAQHSDYATDYMKTAAVCEGICASIRFFGIDCSPYFYRLGKPFDDCGVEQMAQQVEHGVPAILNKVRAASAGKQTPEATKISTNIRWEVRGAGVVT